jgi:hypothetical protein
VVDTSLEGETVLLHLKSKLYFGLNATGSRIWSGLKERLTLEQISCRLQQEFGIDSEHAEHSVLTLIDELLRQQLVEAEPSRDR